MQSRQSGILLSVLFPFILMVSLILIHLEDPAKRGTKAATPETNPSGCLSCHVGILPFAEGKMMEKIETRGRRFGDSQGCTICHGGTPSAGTAAEAHRNTAPLLGQDGGPQGFYPNPGALSIAEFTCGQCHAGYPQRVLKSLSSTKTEEMHRDLCLYALKKQNKSVRPNTADTRRSTERTEISTDPDKTAERTNRRFGAYAVEDKDGHVPAIGTAWYREIVAKLAMDKGLFADNINVPPELDESQRAQLERTGEWTQACAACHDTGAPERSEEFHGTGCAACHVPYRSGGTYLGDDPTIDKNQPGKLLLHRLQGTANTMITLPVHGDQDGLAEEAYRGISMDNCFTCHNDVRDVALNPIGSVISHYGQRHRDQMGGDMLCQDCHTTIDMHGDGNIPVTSRAQIEIRCEDCHGTVTRAPWELPLGYDGKPGSKADAAARGMASEPPDVVGAGYDGEDGYLLTSRGNPFGNVVKKGDDVVVHSASGDSFLVPILKTIKQNKSWKSPLSRQAMFETPAHSEKMACMDCHKDQVQPPCLGCHVSTSQDIGSLR